ncbi:hypothetical protein [Leuconostoc mesenteroides]|uniref:hypothetical protein n=1 Tax=Leuconostoc mesenteroides TaxID=1245 RepID=UPI0023603C53|nr:hypothetical protein [Leuconostoc mesenteroides]
MKFYAKSLNFTSYSTNPEENVGLTLHQIQSMVDWFSALVDQFRESSDIDKYETIIGKPFNCVVGQTDTKIIIGFTNYMALRDNNTMDTFNHDSLLSLSLEDAITKMETQASNELGLEKYIFATFDKNLWYSAREFLNSIYSEAEQTDDFIINIVNKYAGQQDTRALNCLSGMIQSVFQYLEELTRKKNKMNINPIFKADNLVIDPKMVFCALPFNDSRLEIFTDIIRPHLESMELNAIKINDVKSITGNIMENIWTYINKSRCVIVDISDRNPNVFYELGICHTVGKDTIIICDEDSFKNDYNNQFPFDISGLNTIVYKNRGAGMERLKEELSLVIQAVLTGKDVIV